MISYPYNGGCEIYQQNVDLDHNLINIQVVKRTSYQDNKEGNEKKIKEIRE